MSSKYSHYLQYKNIVNIVLTSFLHTSFTYNFLKIKQNFKNKLFYQLFYDFRADKEKSKFQQEVYELLAQLDCVTKEKLMSIKTVEKLEVHISELNVKIEELNRTIVDITSHKTRLSQENIELVKEVQDLKVIDFTPTECNYIFLNLLQIINYLNKILGKHRKRYLSENTNRRPTGGCSSSS